MLVSYIGWSGNSFKDNRVMDQLNKTNENLISVIIPVYNGEKYLSECLESVLNQTYQNLEIIIVNDGSTDNTENIINKYKENDSRIKNYKFENQRGVAAARNFGIKSAKGKYISFIDSDDYYNTDCIETLHSQMNDDCDIICCGYNVISDDKKEKYELKNEEYSNAEDAYLFYLESNKTDYTMQVIWAKLFRRDSIIDEKFKSIKYGEDTLFIVEMIASNAHIKLIDYVGYNYREHQDSVVIKSQRKNTEYYDSMLNMHYCCYVTMKDVSNHIKEESALYYKHEVLDVSCKLKRWYRDKKAFIQNSRIVRKHLKKVKSVCNISFKECAFLYMYSYCPRILWFFV